MSEWLKFAEAKHAGLFAVWIAFLGIVANADASSDVEVKIKFMLLIAICIGTMIEVLSFLPFLNRLDFFRQICYEKYYGIRGNAVFYQSVFIETFSKNNMDVSLDKYKQMLEQRGIQTEDKLIVDYIKQIIEVAAVGTIKTYLFTISAKYTFLVLFSAFVALIVIA